MLLSLRNFNSIKVQLKQVIMKMVMPFFLDFNSIKVQLKRFVVWANSASITNFNSIKVQLKQVYFNRMQREV